MQFSTAMPSPSLIPQDRVRDGKYLPTLDGWRAVAILIVVAAHASDSIGMAAGLDLHALHAAGLFGVQIFFGLSGFLITSRLIADERGHGRISLASFYIRRAFRIMPASLAFLAVVGLLAWAGVLPVSFGRWIGTVLFFANYSTAQESWYLGHFWSLAVEEHFYFVWPLVFLVLGAVPGRVRFALAVAIGVALWRAVDFKFAITGASPDRFWGRTDIEADAIAWGVVVALLYSGGAWRARLEALLRVPATVPALIAFLVLGLVFPAQDWKLMFLLVTLKAVAIPLLILGAMLEEGILFKLLETPVLRLIGRLSYSLYLWQQLFLVWAGSAVPAMEPLQHFPLNVVMAVACAGLSMVFVERPMIGLGHRITARLRRPVSRGM